MPALWTVGLYDASGTPLTENGGEYSTMGQIVEPAYGGKTLSLAISLEHPEAAAVTQDEYQPYIAAWWQPEGGTENDRVLRFVGPVWTDEVKGAEGVVIVTAIDAMVYLRKRFATAIEAGIDLGELLFHLVDETNLIDGSTGINTEPEFITASSVIDADYSQNKPSIESLITQFQSQLDGVEAWIEPVFFEAGVIGNLYAAPRRGATNTDVLFAYGEGTQDNCDDMTRTRNKDLMENDCVGYSDTLLSQKTNETSVSAFRRLQGITSATGETNQTALDARTQGRLDERYSPNRVAEYTADAGSSAPALGDAYEVGDTVSMHFREGMVEWLTERRVIVATTPWDDLGLELPSKLGFKAVPS